MIDIEQVALKWAKMHYREQPETLLMQTQAGTVVYFYDESSGEDKPYFFTARMVRAAEAGVSLRHKDFPKFLNPPAQPSNETKPR